MESPDLPGRFRLTSNPGDAADLGAGLRALRGKASLRRLAARQPPGPGATVLGKSTLARYEAGDLPPLEYAEHLDQLYEGKGWVEMSIRSLWRPRWNPWLEDHGVARKYHAGRWPAEYGGAVWIKLKPQPEFVSRQHEIELEWGPWGRRVTRELPRDGFVLLTGKAVDDDGISRVCNTTVKPPCYALYGAGEDLEGEEILDVRRGWSKANRYAEPEEYRYGPGLDSE